MEVGGHYATWTITAGEDLDNFKPGTGAIFKAIALDNGKLAQYGKEAGGILIYGGKERENVTLAYAGIVKFTAGEDIPAGVPLTVGNDGYFFVAKPGDWIVGRCLDVMVHKGRVGTGAFNFASVSLYPKE